MNVRIQKKIEKLGREMRKKNIINFGVKDLQTIKGKIEIIIGKMERIGNRNKGATILMPIELK